MSSEPRRAGVASPEELQSFVEQAGDRLVVLDLRNPDAAVEPDDQPSLARAPLPEGEVRPAALHVVWDRPSATMEVPSSLTPDTPIITHCGAGGRGQLAKEYLERQGFTNVINGGGPKETACWKIYGGKLYDAVKECLEETHMLAKSIHTLHTARSMGCTIIHCPISFESGHHEISKTPYGILSGIKEGAAFTAGTWGADFVDGMQPKPGDLVVKGKSGLCGFASTNLDFLLRQNKIRNVVLAGFLTNCCVESTMRTAYELGYQVYTLQDCVAATSMAAQTATLTYNFGMFSVPTTSTAILNAMPAPTLSA